MVERTYSLDVPGTEASDHRDLLQKLQHELEAEKEAAATSATEALSMILRLQGEKATLTMEATQYKRIAEEKMCHAEISLALFEDLTYQKEMEITSLRYQVQAYRCFLLSLGCSDLAGVEMKFPENNDNIMWQMNDFFLGQTSGNKIRQLQSLPVTQLSDSSNESRSTFEYERSLTPSPEPVLDSVPVEKEVIEQSLDSRKVLYWEQIKKLDEQVKMLEQEDSASSSNVQDIFEVPEPKGKAKGKSACEGEERLGSPDLVVEGKVKPDLEDEKGSLKAVLNKAELEKKLSKPPRGNKNRECAAVSDMGYQAEFQQLRERIERIEGERSTTRHEIREDKEEEEELSLLKEIKEQLNLVQSEMRSLRTAKKSPHRDDSAILSVQEAMLYFWM